MAIAEPRSKKPQGARQDLTEKRQHGNMGAIKQMHQQQMDTLENQKQSHEINIKKTENNFAR